MPALQRDKETIMATMDAPTMDRRQLPERRSEVRNAHHAAMSALDYLAMALLIVGGLNWAVVGLIDVNVLATLFGSGSALTRVIYVVVGLAALYAVYLCVKMVGSRR
jgi:uncharacterized membrane protein YuzA (DUF378 family)